MRILKQSISIIAAIAMFAIGIPFIAQAQTQRAYRLSDNQVKQIIQRVENRADTFKRNLDTALDRSKLNGTREEDEVNSRVSDFENATNQLRDRFNDRSSVSQDVQAVMNSAFYINDFMRKNYLNRTVQSNWTLLRRDLDSLASAYNVTWNWDGRYLSTVNTQTPYRLSDRDVEQLLNRVDQRANDYKGSLDRALDNSKLDGTKQEDNINKFVSDFRESTKDLRQKFNRRTSVATDVETVLSHAKIINDFMLRHRLSPEAQNDWFTLRGELDELGRVYNVAWDWNRTLPPTVAVSPRDARMTGTYRLNTQRSDNPQTIADRATNRLPFNNRQQVYETILNRITPPDGLALERRGQTVNIASTNVPKSTLEADGTTRWEQNQNRRNIRVNASFKGEQLVVTSSGDRDTDFEVTFTPISNGNELMMTRNVYVNDLKQNVVARSFFDRTTEYAQWNVYNDSGQSAGINDFIVEDGTEVFASLNDELTTKTAKDNDRFVLTVRSPSKYEGAQIEGYVTNVKRSGRITGRSEMTFNLEKIRLRDGRTYKFAGVVESVTVEGERVRVDKESGVQEGDNRTGTTAKRTAAGAAIGAIIGAIAGGGKGAAIGAVIGAGTGAGSVYVQGRDDLELKSGSEVVIRASAPRNTQ